MLKKTIYAGHSNMNVQLLVSPDYTDETIQTLTDLELYSQFYQAAAC